jgi:integrase
MAKIITRVWTSRGPTGRRVRHVSYGYHAVIDGKRERCVSAEWTTEAEALAALNRRLAAAAAGRVSRPAGEATLGALAAEYLRYKADHGKRSLREDRRILNTRLLPAFSKDLPARRLSEGMIAQYEKKRAGQVSAFTVCNELTVLRHMLRLGRRWEYLETVPEIAFPKKDEPRQRYLTADEITRLLAACAGSKNGHLATIIAVALNTGMRKAEILGLEWAHVNLQRLHPHALQDQERQATRHPRQRRPRGGPPGARAGRSPTGGPAVQAEERRSLGADPDRVREGPGARRH